MLNKAIQHALVVGCFLAVIQQGMAQSTEGLALVANADTNISQTNNDQFDVDVAIDRSNTQRVFFISDDDSTANGLFVGVSVDGGATFATRAIADGMDGLNIGNDQPVCTFDGFGNLFIAYRELNGQNATIHVALSIDGGATFTDLESFGPDTEIERPAIAARNGDIWLAYRDNTNGGVVTRFIQSTALNQLTGNFSALETLQGSGNGSFVDVTIGPGGEAYVCYQTPLFGTTDAEILINIDEDGPGGNAFGSAFFVSDTNVGGQDDLPAQGAGTISSSPSIAVDLSNGPNAGRVYVVYAEEAIDESNDTDVFIRSSPDKGVTWSSAARVNDTATNSQFLPRVAVDAANGAIVVSWYDCRNDAGDSQGTDSNGVVNDDAEFFVSASIDGGLSFLANVLASAGSSNATASGNATGYGDRTALDFLNGRAFPVRPDNSTQLGNNPNLPNFDLATTPLDVTVTLAFQSITPSKVEVASAEEFTVTLVLNTIAAAGGFTISLTESGDFTIASSVTINQGESSATLQVKAPTVPSAINGSITALGNGVTLQQAIPVAAAVFDTFTISPLTFTGSQSFTGSIGIDVLTQKTAFDFTLTSDNSIVTLPAQVTIPIGSSTVAFSGKVPGATELVNVTITAELQGQTRTQNLVLEVGDTNSGSSSGSCFIATAAYGSSQEAELIHLRRIRDRRLLTSEPGCGFTKTYYANSPLAARQLRKSCVLRAVARDLLRPITRSSKFQSDALSAALGL